MKFHEWGVGVDPDESCWVESVKFNVSFLVVIRLFYEIGSPAYEEIGKNTFTYDLLTILKRGHLITAPTRVSASVC